MPAARQGRWRIAGVGRKRPSGARIERGLHGKHERDAVSRSRAPERGLGERAELAEMRGRGENGPWKTSPHSEASAAVGLDGEATERQDACGAELERSSNGSG